MEFVSYARRLPSPLSLDFSGIVGYDDDDTDVMLDDIIVFIIIFHTYIFLERLLMYGSAFQDK